MSDNETRPARAPMRDAIAKWGPLVLSLCRWATDIFGSLHGR